LSWYRAFKRYSFIFAQTTKPLLADYRNIRL